MLALIAGFIADNIIIIKDVSTAIPIGNKDITNFKLKLSIISTPPPVSKLFTINNTIPIANVPITIPSGILITA